ncbi:MAG: hypothetical protein WDO56_19940 [Gammaproteobacteria bacterium]
MDQWLITRSRPRSWRVLRLGSRRQARFHLPRYTSQGIVYRLLIAVAAKQDLATISADDPDTGAEILTLLQELKGSQLLLDSLT